MGEVETRSKDLRKRSRKLRGEARDFVESQAADLDKRRQELQTRIETLSADLTQLLAKDEEEREKEKRSK